jgi:hypothetical protein
MQPGHISGDHADLGDETTEAVALVGWGTPGKGRSGDIGHDPILETMF